MKQIAIALFALASTFGVGNAMAQEHPVRATIPFNFTVGDKVLPTGTYTVRPVGENIIEIFNENGTASVLSSVDVNSDAYTDPHLTNAILVFDREGDHYFLREVDGGPGAVNDSLPLSKAEQRSRHQETLALNQSQVSIPASEGN